MRNFEVKFFERRSRFGKLLAAVWKKLLPPFSG
jgi:hypothetical protein